MLYVLTYVRMYVLRTCLVVLSLGAKTVRSPRIDRPFFSIFTESLARMICKPGVVRAVSVAEAHTQGVHEGLGFRKAEAMRGGL